ncbi:hypothetical protein CR513_28559, partial [Mucuna pruriens]
MPVTFHETQSFLVNLQLQGESIAEVKFVLGQEKPTLVPQQIELYKPEVNVPEDDNDSKKVIDNMPITLRKGKRLCVRYLMYRIFQFICIDRLFL